MTKKVDPMSDDKDASTPLADTVKESAQQIWLAGLGAFSKAQAEGGKVFETLVKEGLSIQRKTQLAAEERFTEATSKMTTMASDMSSKAGHQWGKLENIFEDRVAKALNKLGVPSSDEVEALKARLDEMNKKMQEMTSKAATSLRGSAKPAAKAAVRPAAKRGAAKKPD